MSAVESFAGTREAWCEAAIAALIPELAGMGITHPAPDERDVRIAVTPTGRRALGTCRPSRYSIDGKTNFIVVSTAVAAPIDLVHVLAHELLHAFDNCQVGHRGRWKRWADRLGIETKGTERTPNASALFERVLAAIGTPTRHVPSQPHGSPTGGNLPPLPKEPPPLTALECPKCGQRCHYSTARLDDRAIRCGRCDVNFIVATILRRARR